VPEGDNHRAKYLYCVIPCGGERSFPGAPAVDGGPVHTVVFQDLACVVSDSPDMRYDCTRANMLAHARVIEQVMREGFPVLPVRFNTVTRRGSAEPAEDIRRRLLEGRSPEFHRLLQELGPRVELGLKAFWRDPRAVLEEIASGNKEIRGLRDSLLPLMGRPPAATHFQRARLGEMVKAALARQREQEARGVLSRLRPWAWQVRENPVLGDRVVLNAAFLVDREQETAFDGLVGQLEEELGARMALKYSGPHPPFNFCEVVVSWEG